MYGQELPIEAGARESQVSVPSAAKNRTGYLEPGSADCDTCFVSFRFVASPPCRYLARRLFRPRFVSAHLRARQRGQRPIGDHPDILEEESDVCPPVPRGGVVGQQSTSDIQTCSLLIRGPRITAILAGSMSIRVISPLPKLPCSLTAPTARMTRTRYEIALEQRGRDLHGPRTVLPESNIGPPTRLVCQD